VAAIVNTPNNVYQEAAFRAGRSGGDTDAATAVRSAAGPIIAATTSEQLAYGRRAISRKLEQALRLAVPRYSLWKRSFRVQRLESTLRR
jgi:hypothetical protein